MQDAWLQEEQPGCGAWLLEGTGRQAAAGAHEGVRGTGRMSPMAWVQAAWLWLWDFLSRSMAATLEVFGDHASIVQTSWDALNDQYTPVELGSVVYDTLCGLAPNLGSIFKQPRDITALKLYDMVATVASFADNNETMRSTITSLGFRHVRYGVHPHHIPIMGQVILFNCSVCHKLASSLGRLPFPLDRLECSTRPSSAGPS